MIVLLGGSTKGKVRVSPQVMVSPTTMSLDPAARNGASSAGRGASALLAHDAALDEHHDQAAFLFVVAQAISPGSRKGLTLVEGLPYLAFMSFIMSRTLRCCCARAVLAMLPVARVVMSTIKARMRCLPLQAIADSRAAGDCLNASHRDGVRHVVRSPTRNRERGEESTHADRSIHVDIEWLTNC
jgi:hypothetical protein